MTRRHESLIPLSHEHHDALLLAWRLRTGDLSKREPQLRAKHVSTFFDYRLINHLKLEEELLFPAVDMKVLHFIGHLLKSSSAISKGFT